MPLRFFFQCRVNALSQWLCKSARAPNTQTSIRSLVCDVTNKLTSKSPLQNSNAMQYQRLVTNTLQFVLRESLCPQNTVGVSVDDADELRTADHEGNQCDNGNDQSVSKGNGTVHQAIGLTQKRINDLVAASLTKQGVNQVIAQNKDLLRNAWEAMSVYCYYVHDTSSARGRFIAQSQHNANSLNTINSSFSDNSTKSTNKKDKSFIANKTRQSQFDINSCTKGNIQQVVNDDNDAVDDDDDTNLIYWFNWNDVMHDVAKSIPFEGVTQSEFVQRIQQHCRLFATHNFCYTGGGIAGECDNSEPSVLPSLATVNKADNSTSNTCIKNNRHLSDERRNAASAIGVPARTLLSFTPFIFSHKKSLAQWVNVHFSHLLLVTRSAVTHIPLYHSRQNNSINCELFTSSSSSSCTSSNSAPSATVTFVDRTDNTSNANLACNNNDHKGKKNKQSFVHEQLVNALQFALRVVKGQEQAQVPQWTDLNQLLPLLPTSMTQQITNWIATMQHPCVQSIFETRPFIGLRCKPTHYRVMIIVDLVSQPQHASPLRTLWMQRCALLASLHEPKSTIPHNNQRDTSMPQSVQQVADVKLLDYLSSLQILHDLPVKTKFAVKILYRHADLTSHLIGNDGTNTANNQQQKIRTSSESYTVNKSNSCNSGSGSSSSSSSKGDVSMDHDDHTKNKQINQLREEHNVATSTTSTPTEKTTASDKYKPNVNHEAIHIRSNQHTYNNTNYTSGNNESKQIEGVVVDKFLEVQHVLGALVQTIQSYNNSTRLIKKPRQRSKYTRAVNSNSNSSVASSIENNYEEKERKQPCEVNAFDLLQRIVVLTTRAKRSVVESVLSEHEHNYRASVEVRTLDC